jgi:type I restriction enzyme R subunit
MSAHKEIRFEEAIEVSLTQGGGFEKGDPGTFDAIQALFPDEVIAFITDTQQARWQALVDFHGASAGETLISSLAKELAAKGI